MNFSDNLIKLRKGKGWSQEELADKLGLSRQAISKWEVGTSKPDIDNLIKISKLFEISIDELVNNEIIKTEAISIYVNKNNKRDRVLKWLRLLMIVLVIIYVVYVIYKFVMLFRITQAELQYKDLNNYHYVITKYDENGLKKQEECWYKDGVSKTVNITYNGENELKKITCMDFNSNVGYVQRDDLETSYLNLNETSNEFINNGKNLFYLKLPVEVRNENKFLDTMLSVADLDMNIIVQQEDIFFYFNNNFIHFKKGSMEPELLYYKDNSYNTYITTYFTIELNCVDELKI